MPCNCKARAHSPPGSPALAIIPHEPSCDVFRSNTVVPPVPLTPVSTNGSDDSTMATTKKGKKGKKPMKKTKEEKLFEDKTVHIVLPCGEIYISKACASAPPVLDLRLPLPPDTQTCAIFNPTQVTDDNPPDTHPFVSMSFLDVGLVGSGATGGADSHATTMVSFDPFAEDDTSALVISLPKKKVVEVATPVIKSQAVDSELGHAETTPIFDIAEDEIVRLPIVNINSPATPTVALHPPSVDEVISHTITEPIFNLVEDDEPRVVNVHINDVEYTNLSFRSVDPTPAGRGPLPDRVMRFGGAEISFVDGKAIGHETLFDEPVDPTPWGRAPLPDCTIVFGGVEMTSLNGYATLHQMSEDEPEKDAAPGDVQFVDEEAVQEAETPVKDVADLTDTYIGCELPFSNEDEIPTTTHSRSSSWSSLDLTRKSSIESVPKSESSDTSLELEPEDLLNLFPDVPADFNPIEKAFADRQQVITEEPTVQEPKPVKNVKAVKPVDPVAEFTRAELVGGGLRGRNGNLENNNVQFADVVASPSVFQSKPSSLFDNLLNTALTSNKNKQPTTTAEPEDVAKVLATLGDSTRDVIARALQLPKITEIAPLLNVPGDVSYSDGVADEANVEDICEKVVIQELGHETLVEDAAVQNPTESENVGAGGVDSSEDGTGLIADSVTVVGATDNNASIMDDVKIEPQQFEKSSVEDTLVKEMSSEDHVSSSDAGGHGSLDITAATSASSLIAPAPRATGYSSGLGRWADDEDNDDGWNPTAAPWMDDTSSKAIVASHDQTTTVSSIDSNINTTTSVEETDVGHEPLAEADNYDGDAGDEYVEDVEDDYADDIVDDDAASLDSYMGEDVEEIPRAKPLHTYEVDERDPFLDNVTNVQDRAQLALFYARARAQAKDVLQPNIFSQYRPSKIYENNKESIGDGPAFTPHLPKPKSKFGPSSRQEWMDLCGNASVEFFDVKGVVSADQRVKLLAQMGNRSVEDRNFACNFIDYVARAQRDVKARREKKAAFFRDIPRTDAGGACFDPAERAMLQAAYMLPDAILASYNSRVINMEAEDYLWATNWWSMCADFLAIHFNHEARQFEVSIVVDSQDHSLVGTYDYSFFYTEMEKLYALSVRRQDQDATRRFVLLRGTMMLLAGVYPPVEGSADHRCAQAQLELSNLKCKKAPIIEPDNLDLIDAYEHDGFAYRLGFAPRDRFNKAEHRRQSRMSVVETLVRDVSGCPIRKNISPLAADVGAYRTVDGALGAYEDAPRPEASDVTQSRVIEAEDEDVVDAEDDPMLVDTSEDAPTDSETVEIDNVVSLDALPVVQSSVSDAPTSENKAISEAARLGITISGEIMSLPFRSKPKETLGSKPQKTLALKLLARHHDIDNVTELDFVAANKKPSSPQVIKAPAHTPNASSAFSANQVPELASSIDEVTSSSPLSDKELMSTTEVIDFAYRWKGLPVVLLDSSDDVVAGYNSWLAQRLKVPTQLLLMPPPVVAVDDDELARAEAVKMEEAGVLLEEDVDRPNMPGSWHTELTVKESLGEVVARYWPYRSVFYMAGLAALTCALW